MSLIGICAAILARWKSRADMQADAAAHLRECGYTVFYHPWHPLLFGTSERPGVWRRCLGDQMFEEVRVVAGRNVDNFLAEEDLQNARQFLDRLPYKFCLVTSLASTEPVDLTSLAEIANLESLQLNDVAPLPLAGQSPQCVPANIEPQSLRSDIESLQALSGLREFNVTNLRIGDSLIEDLSKLQQLTSLNVRHTDLSSDGLIRLKRAMPTCKIEDDNTPIGPCFPFEW